MSILSPESSTNYTYSDYLKWPEEERWEIINGVPYLMSPAPSTEHQRISTRLIAQLELFAADKPCSIFHAPFDVRLPRQDEPDEDVNTVVQPDIVVVCDQNKLDSRGCKGAPDLLVEIISLSTAKKDLNEKFNLYERSGVREYWIVWPNFQAIDIYHLNEQGKYEKIASFSPGDTLSSKLIPGLDIKVERVFAK
ncbi:MAG: Uma2 family endonuclease [Syntrophomonadaceae bacterium]|nr:Uma2 family endonuclease [Syntrophomonadaceae bacterium]